MNGPGLSDSIENNAQIVENQKQLGERDEEAEDELAFLTLSRWWFASTAFPMIAGTFGPMASAFSICALAVPWQVSIPSGGVEAYGEYIGDPGWLIGINAAQLAIALMSNLLLSLNMARRVRFSIAQPATIIGWYISSLTLVGLTATAAGPLRLESHPEYAFSQAFYYAVFSAGLYFFVASLMVVTVIGAYMGRYEKEFKLTTSQRTLMLQTISFLVYLLAGAAVYAHIESWTFLDAVYFADLTLLTVGIGDITPTTNLGRGLLFPYAIGGIITLGLVISSIRSFVLERGKVMLGARMVEKERQRILKKIQQKTAQILIPISQKKPGFSRTSPRFLGDGQDGLTERQRREKEFRIMRKVQERAATRRQWTALAISGLTWFALWFIGARIFQIAEYGQQWTYFQALYFAYTSLLTIGYGDLAPVSNLGKVFFVFWSLLAIPTLTILISNMGDTVAKAVREFTLWIGTWTVLPSEKRLRADIKKAVWAVTHQKDLTVDLQENPPGILGESDKATKRGAKDDEGGGADHHRKNDPESAAQRAASGQANLEAKRAKEEGETSNERTVPKSKRHYHSMLIKEISSVMRHLNSSPPRKYDFDEWAWYLKLIGEDESSPETHRNALRNPKGDAGGLGEAGGMKMQENGKTTWSWVGKKSPLMGNKAEAEWVLERLTKTLEMELEAMRREEEEKEKEKGDG